MLIWVILCLRALAARLTHFVAYGVKLHYYTPQSALQGKLGALPGILRLLATLVLPGRAFYARIWPQSEKGMTHAPYPLVAEQTRVQGHGEGNLLIVYVICVC
jgi:hypothetical protein